VHETGKPLLNVLKGKPEKRFPIWFMRQAGRYLPEYRTLRAKAGNFLDLCLNSEWAAEITLQPIERFDLDAVILFSDILMVPYGFSLYLDFREGEGPVLERVTDERKLDSLRWDMSRLGSVIEALKIVKSKVPEKVASIGFAGSPWTVACYMIEGKGKKGFLSALEMAEKKPEFLSRLIVMLHNATVEYLGKQIEAGADLIMLFDSHAGLLKGEMFNRWIIQPTLRLVKDLKDRYPGTFVAGFPRNAGQDEYSSFVNETGVDILGFDQKVSLKFAREELQGKAILQGNLDPVILVEGGEKMKKAATDIMEKLGPRHIFNLGHGILPETPPENVSLLVNHVHSWSP